MDYLWSDCEEMRRQKDTERYAAPFFWMIVVIAALFVVDAMAEHWMFIADSRIESAILAELANGKPVEFDNMVLQCNMKAMIWD